MSPINDRQLARKLRAGKTPEPPPGLLEELRRQIPQHIEAPSPRQGSSFVAGDLGFRLRLHPRRRNLRRCAARLGGLIAARRHGLRNGPRTPGWPPGVQTS